VEAFEVLTKVADLGVSGILLVILFNLWREYQATNKFIRDILLQAQAERAVLAEQLGLRPDELKEQAAAKREGET